MGDPRADHRPDGTEQNGHDDADVLAPRASVTRAKVTLRAEGRGFQVGVDIEEMQRTEGWTALIDANRGYDVQRMKSSYHLELGCTFELNPAGASDEPRDAFAGTSECDAR